MNLPIKALIVLKQDIVSAKKNEFLLKNVNFHDKEKYIFVCNRYQSDEKNAYDDVKFKSYYSVSEYIPELGQPPIHYSQLVALNEIQRLSYIL